MSEMDPRHLFNNDIMAYVSGDYGLDETVTLILNQNVLSRDEKTRGDALGKQDFTESSLKTINAAFGLGNWQGAITMADALWVYLTID